MKYKRLIKRFLIITAGFVSLLLIVKISGFNGQYGADSYEYARYSLGLRDFFSTGAAPGSFFWPILYPLSGALLSFVFNPLLSLQLVSIITFLGTLIYLYLIIKMTEHSPDHSEVLPVYLFLFGFLSPYFLRLALSSMSDMLSIFFYTGAVFYIIKYRLCSKNRYFFLAAAFSSLAVFTHYSAALVLLIPLLYLLFYFLSRNEVPQNGFQKFPGILNKLLAMIGVLVFTSALLFCMKYIRHDLFPNTFSHPLLQRWSVKNFFLSEFNSGDGAESYRYINLIYEALFFFQPGFCFLGILFLPFIIVSSSPMHYFVLVINFSLAFYLLFLMGLPYQNTRLVTLAFPLLLILYYKPFRKIMGTYFKARSKRIVVYGCIGIIQLTFFVFALRGINNLSKSDRILCERVGKYTPDKTIYTYGINGALRTYGIKNKIIDLGIGKITSIPGNSLILVDEKELQERWQGRLLMENWKFIRANYALKKTDVAINDWILYEYK